MGAAQGEPRAHRPELGSKATSSLQARESKGSLYEFVVHGLNVCPCDKGSVRPEASSEGMWNMQDFMNQYLGLLLFAEPIKPLGEDLDNVMRVLVQGELHNP